MRFFRRLLSLSALPVVAIQKPPHKVGGQAIIEGVMMRSRKNVSWAVRKPDGEIVIEREQFISFARRHRKLAIPVLRGAINLYESMLLGYKALSRSADILSDAEEKAAAASPNRNGAPKQKKRRPLLEKLYSTLSFGIALVFAVGLFMYLPMWVLTQLVPKESVVLFNTLAGAIRIVLFVGYIYLISLWKEIRRVFEYHGAEHKAIFTFEDGKELLPENMRGYSTVHPRCGTSFLLIVGLLCILLFSVVDGVVIGIFGPYPTVAARLLAHLLLVPAVAGTSYEILRFSDRHKKIPIVGMMIKPGLWLQKITTREPDEQQLAVASTALKAVV